MSNEQLAHPELAAVQIEEDSGDLSRSDVLLKGALAVGAIYGTAMVGPYVSRALAASGGSDVDILNFALTLEYLEAKFYEEAKMRAKPSGELKSLVDLIASDEQQHVEALEATIKKLGGKPVMEPKFNFHYNDTAGFLELAQTFEDTGVSAYNGAGPMIKSKEVLAAAGGDRPGRGPARGGDPLAERRRTGAGGLRPPARRKAGFEGGRTVPRLAREQAG